MRRDEQLSEEDAKLAELVSEAMAFVCNLLTTSVMLDMIVPHILEKLAQVDADNSRGRSQSST